MKLSETTASRWDGAGASDAHLQGVTLFGDDGDEILVGAEAEGYLAGGAGGDVLIAGAGNNGINGGAGRDLPLSVQAAHRFSTIGAELAEMIDTALEATAALAAVAWRVNEIVGTSYGDRLCGRGADDGFSGGGGGGADVLIEGGGDDILNGGAGNDILNAGRAKISASSPQAAARVASRASRTKTSSTCAVWGWMWGEAFKSSPSSETRAILPLISAMGIC
jgi:Ca2+-binding RTX toxin-like protein